MLRIVPGCMGSLLMALLGGCSGVEVAYPLDALDQITPISEGATKYVIQPGDELEIKFFHTPELDLNVPVRPDGYLSLPLGGEILAAGKTAEELDGEITARYAGELREPQIGVIVRSFSAYKFHVGGEVDAPGVFDLNGPLTVIQALFQAGGFLDSARLNEVLVIRRVAQGKHVVVPLDILAAIDGRDPAQDIRIMPYDAIFVPRSAIADVNVWVDRYVRRNIPISFGIRPSVF